MRVTPHRSSIVFAAVAAGLVLGVTASPSRAIGFHTNESIALPSNMVAPMAMAVGDVTGTGRMAIAYFAGSQLIILEDSQSGWQQKASFNAGTGSQFAQVRFAVIPGSPDVDPGWFFFSSNNLTISVARRLASSGVWSLDAVLGPFQDLDQGGFSQPAVLAGPTPHNSAWRIAVSGNSLNNAWSSIYLAEVLTPSDVFSVTRVHSYFPVGAAVTGDFDGNGHSDVAVPSTGAGGLVMDYATSAGYFGGWSVAPLSKGWATVAGRIDSDGMDDIASAGLDSLYILLSTGTGFNATAYAAPPPIGGHLSGMAMADLNGDGVADVVLLYDNGGTIWMNDGTGHFSGGVPFATAGGLACAIADMDGDGNPDILVGRNTSIEIYHGLGDGTFGTPSGVPLANGLEYGMALTDVNNDGHLDVVVTGESASLPLQVLASNGGGGLNNLGTFSGAGANNYFISPIAQNGGGFAGVATANSNAALEATTPDASGALLVHHPVPLSGAPPVDAVSVAHLAAANSLPEFAIATGDSPAQVELYDSATSSALPTVSVPDYPAGILAAPLSGHAWDDLAVVGANGDLVTLIGDGAGNFPTQNSYTIPYYFGAGPRSHLLAFAMLGSTHVLFAATSDGYLAEMPVFPDGSLGTEVVIPAGDELHGVATGDLNGDGNTDVAVCGLFSTGGMSGLSGVRVYYGNGLGGFSGSRLLFTTDPVDAVDVQIAEMNGASPEDLLVLTGDLYTQAPAKGQHAPPRSLASRSIRQTQDVGGSLAVLPGFQQPAEVLAVGPATVRPWSGFTIAASPNPTAGGVRVSFELPVRERVELHVLDVAGRRVASLPSGVLEAGHQELRWDGRDESGRAVRAGLYFVQFRTESRSAVARVVVTR